MAEELKDLIEKIQEEGVNAARQKAEDIEKKALEKSGAILKKAEEEASGLISEAKKKIAKTEESSKESLKQAARDIMLTVKKEINSALDRLIKEEVKKALTPSELGGIIKELVLRAGESGAKDIVISLNKKDLEALEKGFLSELKDGIKKGLALRASEDIGGGFVISYDKGKSHYDFTDKSLAEYIARYVKPHLAEILK